MNQRRSTLQLSVHLVGLVLVPLFTLVFAWRDRAFDYSGGAAKRFDEFAAHADLLMGQSLLFLGAQLALIPAALAFVWLVHGRGRTLVLLGAGLYVVSALGHAAYSGTQILLHRMLLADDQDAMRAVFTSFDESTQFGMIAAPGLLGLVLGSLLLGVGVIRSVELPWWIGAALIAFLVAEFALGGITDWGTLTAAAVWAVAFWGTAAHVWRSRGHVIQPAGAASTV